MINLAVWVAVLTLYWLGVPLGNSFSGPLSIASLVTLIYSVFTLVYLHLYQMPQKQNP